MVLFKRRAVEIPPPPLVPPSDDTNIWFIPATKEYFVRYNDYLARMDYYTQRKFICELTGHSCLTFFEALASEVNETSAIISTFPEALKEPILRKVQFSQISRLDTLVDHLYNQLRTDFYPGEIAIAKINDSRHRVLLREKATFASSTNPQTGEQRPAFSRFRVELLSNSAVEYVVEDSQLTRDRRLFTKMTLRTFIKHAVYRESWTGAPWIVKDEYARLYRIEQAVPRNLQRDKKQQPVPLAPAVTGDYVAIAPNNGGKAANGEAKATNGVSGEPGSPAGKKGKGHNRQHLNGDDAGSNAASPSPSVNAVQAKPKSIPKVEDLTLPFTIEEASRRPSWKQEELFDNGAIGSLLESWTFIAAFSKPLNLSPITFEEFCFAFTDEQMGENIINEVHCSLISQFVAEGKSKLLVDFPYPKEEVSDEETTETGEGSPREEGDEDDSKEESTEDPKENHTEDSKGPSKENSEEHTDNVKNGRTTKIKNEDEMDIDNDESDEETSKSKSQQKEVKETNKARLYANFHKESWIERLKKRLFKDGGWQQIIIGMLADMEQSNEIVDILNVMAPQDSAVTLTNAFNNYYELDISQKAHILQLICETLYSSAFVRNYIDHCLDEVIRLKRVRAERNREYRTLMDNLKTMEDEKRTMLDKASGESAVELVAKFGKRKVSDLEDELAKSNDEFKELVTKCTETLARVYEITDQNAEIDKEITSLNVQRVQALGKDRFCNRYWYFKGSRRIWIQGPSQEDVAALPALVEQKKEFESDRFPLLKSTDWAYFPATVAQVDSIRACFNGLGKREYKLILAFDKLRQELQDAEKKEPAAGADQSRDSTASLTEDASAGEETKKTETADSKDEGVAVKEEPASEVSKESNANNKVHDEKNGDSKVTKSEDVAETSSQTEPQEWINQEAIDQWGHTHYDRKRARRA